jgi:1-acyl-sn-glycerol-3-phosphate acyltransferase
VWTRGWAGPPAGEAPYQNATQKPNVEAESSTSWTGKRPCYLRGHLMTAEKTAGPQTTWTPMQRAIGLAMWLPGVAWITSLMSTLMVAQRFFTADQVDWLTRIYTKGQIRVLGTEIRYVVHPEVDPKRQYMFVQNHVNMLDHCTVYNATPHFKQGVELASHFEIPVYGWFMRQRGTIPVHRGSVRDSYVKLTESIRAEVHRGHSILVFPEGTRTLDGRVAQFKSGMFRIAHSLGLPIVPVAVTGMFEVMRKGEPYIHPGRHVTVYVEKPIETTGFAKHELPQLMDQVRRTISDRVEAYYAQRGEPRREPQMAEPPPSVRRA